MSSAGNQAYTKKYTVPKLSVKRESNEEDSCRKCNLLRLSD